MNFTSWNILSKTLLFRNMSLFLRDWWVVKFLTLRDSVQKKTGLFSDIDHISFNTHPPPPNNDIWQKWLSVRNFTTHPPRRNNDIFLNKRVFDNIFQEVKCNDEDQLLILNTLGKVSKRKLGMSNDHVTKLLAPYSFEGVNYKSKSLFLNSDILFKHPPTSITCHYFKASRNSDFCKIPTHPLDQCY